MQIGHDVFFCNLVTGILSNICGQFLTGQETDVFCLHNNALLQLSHKNESILLRRDKVVCYFFTLFW